MTAIRHYRAPDGTFRKVLPFDQARREVAGWQAVAGLLPVPCLRGVREVQDGCEVVYEDVMASGRCCRLLADSINAADRQVGQATVVRSLVNRVCDSLLAAFGATGAVSRLEDCVPDLHMARLTPGRRLDRWYIRPPLPAWVIDGQRFNLGDLASRALVAGGHTLGAMWPPAFTEQRSALAGHTRWITAITQGDVTEPNITEPLCWLDFEHAGRNVLAGDVANFLWYLLAMGGWLVPAYQASVYERTLCTPVPPLVTPTVNHLRVTTRRVEIDYTWHVGTGRRTALTTLLQRTGGDLGMAVAADGDLTGRLRPFLILRILGVIPLGQMSGPHAALCLAKLAELSSPDLTLPDWCEAVAVAPPEAAKPCDLRTGWPPTTVTQTCKEHHDRSCPRLADHTRR